MTDLAHPASGPRPASRTMRVATLSLPVVALIAGAGTTYTELWSPLDMIGRKPAAPAIHATPAAIFVDVPRIVLTVPGERAQTLALTVMIEVEPGGQANAHMLMPRITDSYNAFLSRIDPVAFGRRGILEIVRAELATRTRFVLGEAAVRDLLITEFRIQ